MIGVSGLISKPQRESLVYTEQEYVVSAVSYKPRMWALPVNLKSKLECLQSVITDEYKALVGEVISELGSLHSELAMMDETIKEAKELQRKETAFQMAEYEREHLLPIIASIIANTQLQERTSIINRIIDTEVLDKYDSAQVINLINKETIALPIKITNLKIN